MKDAKIYVFLLALILLLGSVLSLAEENASINETDDITDEENNETNDDETGINETDDEEDDDLTNSTDNDQNESDDDPNETDDENDDQSDENSDDDANENQSNDTVEQNVTEANQVVHPYGAKVRILQLERRITKHIIIGEEIIVFIEENNTNSTEELESILDELKTLKDEVHTLNVDGSAEELAQEFVAIKRQAIDLIKRFREAARPLLKEADRETLRERIKNLGDEETKELTDRISEARKKHNREEIKKTLDFLGVSDEDLRAKIESGEITIAQVKERLRALYKSLKDDKRKEVSDKLREEMRQTREKGKDAIEKAENRFKERKDNIEERLKERRENIKNKVQEKRENLRERLDVKKTNIKDRVQSKRENLRGSNSEERGE